MHKTRDDRGAGVARRWEASPVSFSVGIYVVAIGVWAAVGLVYLPILSMILTPVWMVLWVSVVPRLVARARGKAPSSSPVSTERTEAA